MKRKRDNKTALAHQRLDQPSKTQIASASKFAEGLCLKKLFFVFLIGSVLGSFYEEILHFVQTWYETGVPVWSLRRGVIYGPFNVIYGFGAAAMTFFLVRKPYKWWEIFLYSALLGGVIEYMISWLQEFFTHTRSWDYHDLWLNIDGRTTIPYMLVWGVLGLILVKFFYPLISHLIEAIPVRIGEILFGVLLAFIFLDMLISWTALLRQTLRHNHVPALTPIGRMYDCYYNDQFLEKYFPNMQHLDQGGRK